MKIKATFRLSKLSDINDPESNFVSRTSIFHSHARNDGRTSSSRVVEAAHLNTYVRIYTYDIRIHISYIDLRRGA